MIQFRQCWLGVRICTKKTRKGWSDFRIIWLHVTPLLFQNWKMQSQRTVTVDIQTLKQECQGVDFDVPKERYDKSFTIGNYIIKYLTTTWEIITTSTNIKNDTILDFVKESFIYYTHLLYLLLNTFKCKAITNLIVI